MNEFKKATKNTTLLLIAIICLLSVLFVLALTGEIRIIPKESPKTAEKETTESIAGNYEFYEFAEPNINMVYDLKINNDNTATINIDGFQTLKRIKAKIEKSNNKYNIIYDENLSEFEEKSYQKGDTLFTIYKVNNEIYTSWNKIQPLLEENKKDGIYFKEATTNVVIGKYEQKSETYSPYYHSIIEINNETGNTIDFKIDTTHGLDIDHVNLGSLKGTAKMVNSNTYVFEENEAKITFEFSNNKLKISENYKDDINPYGGHGVYFAGEYNKE